MKQPIDTTRKGPKRPDDYKFDPNENLKEQLRLALAIVDGKSDAEDISNACLLSAMVFGLNDWLSKGGSLPDAWQDR